MIKTDPTFKIGIYEQVAERMNKAHIAHCAAHGIDYRINHYGRDVDVMIRHQDRHKVRRIISNVFEDNKIHFKINKFSWADWILGYKIVGDEISFIEIDLFYHIYYRMIELTDSKLLGVNKDLKKFYIADWNTYAKVVLLKFYGLEFKNLSSNVWQEIQRCASIQLPSRDLLFEKDFLKSLNNAIANSDYQQISQLKNDNPYWKIAIRRPFQTAMVLKNMIIAVSYRKLKAFHIVPVLLLPEDAKSTFNSFRNLLQKESFFCAVNESTAKKNGIIPILKTYLYYRHHSTPLSLNVIYTNRDNWNNLQKSLFLMCLDVVCVDKDIDVQKILSLII